MAEIKNNIVTLLDDNGEAIYPMVSKECIDNSGNPLLDTLDIVDNVTSTNIDKALSANQGKVLDDKKIDKTSIVNDVVTGGTTNVLSAEQGALLNKKDNELTQRVHNIGIDDLTPEVKKYIQTESGGGNKIINNPDEEDIMSVGTEIIEGETVHRLKFADQDFKDDGISGMGRKYLRKHLNVEGKNVLTQADFDTISKKGEIRYIIRYDYDLGGKTINIEPNSVLDFQGGSFSNGILKGDEFSIETVKNGIFKNINFLGNFTKGTAKVKWFVKRFPSSTLNIEKVDNTLEIQEALNCGCQIIEFPFDKYLYISNTLHILGDIDLITDNPTKRPISITRVINDSSEFPCVFTKDVITMLDYKLKSNKTKYNITIGNIGFVNYRPFTEDLSEKEKPIVRISTTETPIWEANINCTIKAMDIVFPTDEYPIRTLVNYTGLEINADGNYAAGIIVNGDIIHTFYGMRFNKLNGNWFTDTKIYGSTYCVYGGIFNGGDPIDVFGMHQPLGYFKDNENVKSGGYFQGNWINLHTYIWDINTKGKSTKLWTVKSSVSFFDNKGILNQEFAPRSKDEDSFNTLHIEQYNKTPYFKEYSYGNLLRNLLVDSIYSKKLFTDFIYTFNNVSILKNNNSEFKLFNGDNIFSKTLNHTNEISFASMHTVDMSYLTEINNFVQDKNVLNIQFTIDTQLIPAYDDLIMFLKFAYTKSNIKILLETNKTNNFVESSGKEILFESTIPSIETYYKEDLLKLKIKDTNKNNYRFIKVSIEISDIPNINPLFLPLLYIPYYINEDKKIANSSDNIPYNLNSMRVGEEFFDTTKRQNIYWNGSEWLNYDGSPINAYRVGITSQKPKYGYIDGYSFFDVTKKELFIWSKNQFRWFKINCTWDDVPRIANFADRPKDGIFAGFQFFCADTHKTITWNGKHWYFSDGTQAD